MGRKAKISRRQVLALAAVAAVPPAILPRKPRIRSIKRLEETTLRLGGTGDNWHTTWAKDDKQYVCMCDGTGWRGMPQASYNSRMYTIVGDPPKPTFEYMPTYPELLTRRENDEACRYYNFGVLALDERIYQFLSAPNRPFYEPAPRFVGAKLIYSPDLGRTWHNQDGSTPVRWELWKERSKSNMAFFEEEGDAFSLLTVLQMGRNYQYNSDGFVYVYAPQRQSGRHDEPVGDVPRGQEQDLGSRRLRIFRRATRRWRRAMVASHRGSRRRPHLPRGLGETATSTPMPGSRAWSTTRRSGFISWSTGAWAAGRMADGSASPATWDSGPRRSLGDRGHRSTKKTAWMPANDRNARAYQPQIIPKWIAKDGLSFYLVWTDFQRIEGKGSLYYAFNTQKVQVVTT